MRPARIKLLGAKLRGIFAKFFEALQPSFAKATEGSPHLHPRSKLRGIRRRRMKSASATIQRVPKIPAVLQTQSQFSKDSSSSLGALESVDFYFVFSQQLVEIRSRLLSEFSCLTRFPVANFEQMNKIAPFKSISGLFIGN